MTGIERLRALAYKKNFLEPAEARELDAIADQIEREQGGRVSRMRVLSVVTEMERHVLGHEGMEDSPVARWARELRDALGGEKHDPAADVSMSAYDLLPEEDRDAIAWVRERGGLERVKAQRREFMPRSAYERKKVGFLDHIAECERALGRRRETISELNRRVCDLTRENAELRKRAMPEGMCWPVFEDGEPVRIGDFVSDVEVRSVVFRDGGILLSDCTSVPGWGTWRSYKEPIKRPAPKVLDADGVEIRVGDTVYQMGCKYRVSHLHGANGKVRIVYENSGRWVDPKTLTHRAPVLAADGKPLRVGDTVWPKYPSADRNAQVKCAEVVGIQAKYGRVDVRTVYATGLSFLEQVDADRLTHRAPVLAADGKPLRVGDTVWDTNGDELVIGALEDGGHTVTCRYVDVGDAIPAHGMWSPSDLTHERPESWERIEEDARSCTCVMEAIDLVRRARALSERDA